MKVLAINGALRGHKSITYSILSPLLRGMEKAGAETETIQLGELKIHRCIGCLTCWLKTPGECVFKDDMSWILKKLVEAEFIVYGTPLYNFTMTGLLKDFLDRRLPLVLPFFQENAVMKNTSTHPKRYEFALKKMFLVSPCGLPEFKHFEPLVFTFNHYAKISNIKHLGQILCPAADALDEEVFQEQSKYYFNMVEKAGYQLIKDDRVDKELMQEIHIPFFTPEEYRKFVNAYFNHELGVDEK